MLQPESRRLIGRKLIQHRFRACLTLALLCAGLKHGINPEQKPVLGCG